MQTRDGCTALFYEKSAYHLPQKFIRAYKHNEKSEFTAGHYGNGLRLLCMATLHCIWSDDCNWASWATDLGRYYYFSGKLRHKFTRLSEKTIMLAKVQSGGYLYGKGAE